MTDGGDEEVVKAFVNEEAVEPKRITSFTGKNNFLSNFHICVFRYNEITWYSAEHAFQAAKCVHKIEYYKIRDAFTPSDAKRIGRIVTLRPDWDAVKYNIMKEIVTAKFEDERLRDKLLDTGNVELIEGNTWGDKTWGAVKDSAGRFQGENLLGKILMDVRRELQRQQIEKKLYSTREVAKLLHVSRPRVRQFVEEGLLTKVQKGTYGHFKFKHSEVNALLKARRDARRAREARKAKKLERQAERQVESIAA